MAVVLLQIVRAIVVPELLVQAATDALHKRLNVFHGVLSRALVGVLGGLELHELRVRADLRHVVDVTTALPARRRRVKLSHTL